MTQSLHDNQDRAARSGDEPHTAADGHKGFWGTDDSADAPATASMDADVTGARRTSDSPVDSPEPTDSPASAWLSLSRSVDVADPHPVLPEDSLEPKGHYSKTRGGRVVVRRPIRDIPTIEDSVRHSSEGRTPTEGRTPAHRKGTEEAVRLQASATVPRADDGAAVPVAVPRADDGAAVPAATPISRNVVASELTEQAPRQGSHDRRPLESAGAGKPYVDPLGDDLGVELDEPPLTADELPQEPDPYLPADVYMEENPYDLAMGSLPGNEDSGIEPRRRRKVRDDGPLWLDAEYEVIDGEEDADDIDAGQDELYGTPYGGVGYDDAGDEAFYSEVPPEGVLLGAEQPVERYTSEAAERLDAIAEASSAEESDASDEAQARRSIAQRLSAVLPSLRKSPSSVPSVGDDAEAEDAALESPVAGWDGAGEGAVLEPPVAGRDGAEEGAASQEMSDPEGEDDEGDEVDESGEDTGAYEGDLTLLERIKAGDIRARVIVGAAIAVAALLVVYIVGITEVSGKFLPNTSIGDCDVSGLTQQEAEKVLTDRTQNYALTISVGGFTTSVDGASVSVDRNEALIAKEAYEQQSPFAWPFALIFGGDPDVNQGITYDNVKFDQQVSAAIDEYNQKNLPASKARVAYDSVSQTYSIAGSVDGKALDKEVVLDSAHASVATMRNSARPNPDTAFREAELDDLPQFTRAVNNANTVRDASIPILVDGKQVALCDPVLIRSWVSVSDEPAVEVDEDALEAWCKATLSPLVYEDGEWGEQFLDIDEFVVEFAQRLRDGEPGPFEAITYDELNREGTSRAQAYEESPWHKELGRYIDVDLNAQFARLFDASGNVIWESAFVSGDMYEGRQTITGTYELYAHLPGQVLVGLDYNNDGQPDYESYVNFWMPFYEGYGLHDATWRDSFGGDLYMYNGSHGCINLPYDKAAELYSMTAVGDTVYVHE